MSILTPHNYAKLYRFGDPLSTRPFRMCERLTPYSSRRGEDIAIAKGELDPTIALQFDAESGVQATDILWSSSVMPFFISTRLMDLLVQHQVIGWSTYPVELFDRKGEPLTGYHGLAITGAVCKRDRSRSQIVENPPVVPTGQPYLVYKGLYFVESQWDGSDMFWVSPGGRVVTEKVYRLFKKHKIVNVRFTPLSEIEMDVSDDKYYEA